MVDISKHPLHVQIYDLCQAIEACGASPELTKVVTLATELHNSVDQVIDNKPIDFSDITVLPDGSACMTASFPLPKDHWLYVPNPSGWNDEYGTPVDRPQAILTHVLREQVIEAIRYAVRGATANGTIKDFDPDALVQNAVVALCGKYS